MKKLAVDFLEQYKKTDRLCGELLSVQAGVTEYLRAMEASAAKGAKAVPTWDSDYKMLKHLRWLRNKLAHEVGEVEELKAADLKDLKDFHSRLEKGKDPLAILRRPSGAKPKKRVLWPILLLLLLLAAAAVWYFTK